MCPRALHLELTGTLGDSRGFAACVYRVSHMTLTSIPSTFAKSDICTLNRITRYNAMRGESNCRCKAC